MEREPHEVLGVSRFAPWPEVRAAYRALARRYHADGSAPDPRQMAAVNSAYEALERGRSARDGELAAAIAVGPGVPGASRFASAHGVTPNRAPAGSLLARIQSARLVDSPMLDFGQYAGWRIAEVAEHDPRYLVWLSRHSSGIRFRRAIELVLGSGRDLGRPAAVIS